MIYILNNIYQNFKLWILNVMNEDKKWMLMTYYCPTHGDPGRVEPIQVTRREISSNILEKIKSKKKI